MPIVMAEDRCPACEALMTELDCTDCIMLLRAIKAEQAAQALLDRPYVQTRTHCLKGHEMTPENTRIDVRADGDKQSVTRACRACHKLRGIVRQEKKKAAKKAAT
jgi:hypothetical protein